MKSHNQRGHFLFYFFFSWDPFSITHLLVLEKNYFFSRITGKKFFSRNKVKKKMFFPEHRKRKIGSMEKNRTSGGKKFGQWKKIKIGTVGKNRTSGKKNRTSGKKNRTSGKKIKIGTVGEKIGPVGKKIGPVEKERFIWE